jgi:hypothetical protein
VSFQDFIDPDALSGTHHLESLELEGPVLGDVNDVLRKFGSLAHLARLRTVCITINEEPRLAESKQTTWNELDAMLSVLPALANVQVYSAWLFGDVDSSRKLLRREWMPLLSRRGVLHIHGRRGGVRSVRATTTTKS